MDRPEDLPEEVAAIRRELKAFYDLRNAEGDRIGTCKYGIYAFYDFDGEPIYVGQTYNGISDRIGRHLTNQRTDAVAMNVLDPFEVAEVSVWLFDLAHEDKARMKETLNRAEYTVFQKLLSDSELGAILNEKPPQPADEIELPTPFRKRIVPDEIFPRRKHADIRIARRAITIANLARVISERKVQRGLRQTLLTQAQRLERLANQRLSELSN